MTAQDDFDEADRAADATATDDLDEADRAADARDSAADERDRAAGRRDVDAAVRDALESDQSEVARGKRQPAADDRWAAGEDRGRAGSDRRAAARDREQRHAKRVLTHSSPASLTAEQYDEATRLIREIEFVPEGLEYHVCFGSDGQLQITEIWASREQLEAFGEWRGPVLSRVGIDLGKPEVREVYGVIRR